MKQIFYKLIYYKEQFLDWIVLKFFNPYKINPGGNCPVQAEGVLETGEWYYFRARGKQWSLEIYENEKDFWKEGKRLFNYGDRNYCEWPDAGWLSRRKCIRLATKALNEYHGR